MRQVAVNELFLVLLRGLLHLAELIGAGSRQQGGRQFAVEARNIVLPHPSPPNVLGSPPIASIPELQHDQRRARLFPRTKPEVRQLLSRPNPQA